MMKKFPMPKAAPIAKLPKAPMPEDIPTRPVQHVMAPKTPLTAEDPQILEQALLRKMKKFG